MSWVKCSLNSGRIEGEILFKKLFSLEVVFSYQCKVRCHFCVKNKTKHNTKGNVKGITLFF